MAVQKVLSYVDKTGALRTTTCTIDLEKFAIGGDDEHVYLTVTAPGLTSAQTWRQDIDKIVEDGLFANGSASRYSLPAKDFGIKFGLDDAASAAISGVLPQLRAM